MKKILYHGTNNPEKILKNGFNRGEVGLYGDGVYFFQSISFAKNYGIKVIKAQVNISKPFTFTDQQNKLYTKIYNKYKEQESSFPKKDAINELNKKYGFDALKFNDFSRSRKGGIAWVIFNQNKIKVIGEIKKCSVWM